MNHYNHISISYRRHLCEFTGLDIEMAIKDHYNEVLIGKLFTLSN